ncbi:MAG: ferric reductase-like transmembrane domain-containing protein [Angustibacter sp.]
MATVESIGDAPLWYVNRGTGMVLLVVLALTVALGMLSTTRMQARWWPRFLTQGLHRNLSLLAVLLLVVHAGTAVVDEFVDIRWWQAVVPFGATYKPMWLELGTVAANILVATVLSSLFRSRLSRRWWLGIHLLTYPAFVVAVVHSLGIGTDVAESWSVMITVGSVLLVVTGLIVRVFTIRRQGVGLPAPVPGRSGEAPEQLSRRSGGPSRRRR